MYKTWDRIWIWIWIDINMESRIQIGMNASCSLNMMQIHNTGFVHISKKEQQSLGSQMFK